MQYRKFGKTGVKVSIIGLGGGFLNSAGFEEGRRIVFRALEAGINYFDTAPSYSGGESERIISEALGKHKESMFIATKVLSRGYENAKKEIQGSLERLRKIDLIQLHAVDTPEALDAVWGPDGALKAVEELEEDLKIVEKLIPLNSSELKELKTYTESIIKKETPWWQQKPVGMRDLSS